MTDVFAAYERGLAGLLRRLDKDHPRYTEALTLQTRLLENIIQYRRYGDTDTRRAQRAQILDSLNRLALGTVGEDFNALCGSTRGLGTPSRARDEAARPREWNTATIRGLLTVAFDDEELVALCFDHFRAVYEGFSVGMSKTRKIQRLLDYCSRQGQVGKLLRVVEERNPAQYTRFRNQLL